ncbi:hypothetical protein D5086_007286 [Populus alba]|uniref:Uncharacterized protein n=1 Tax=Populus alba TaxID=43335 RepID=A0ACC4CN44_POPAL
MNQSWYENSLYKVISDRLVHLQMMMRNYLYYAIIFWWGYKVRMYSVKVRLCELPRLRVSNTSKLQTWGFSVHDCDRFDYIMCDYAFLGVHMAPCDAAVHTKLPYLSDSNSSVNCHVIWSALYQLHLVKSETARAFIPKEFRLVEAFGYTLGGFFLASYEDSPAGVFDELVVIAGTVWNPPTSCAWAARVLVNSGDACDHGRKEVGLPSQVAKFSKKITAVPRQRKSKFSGFLDKIGLGTASSSTKSCMDVLVTETNDRSTTDICNINLTAVVPGMKFDKWKGPAIKMSLPSFSGRTEYNPSLLKYSCNIECRVRAVRAAKVSRPSLTSKQDAEESLSEHERQNLTISVMLSKPILALEFSCLSMQVEAPVVVSQHSTSRFATTVTD